MTEQCALDRLTQELIMNCLEELPGEAEVISAGTKTKIEGQDDVRS